MSGRSIGLKIVLVLFFCAFSLSAEAGFFYGKQKFYTVKTEHFYIHYPQDLGGTAKDMMVIAENSFDRITGRLEWVPRGRTHVVLSDKTDVANGLATIMPFNYILVYVTPPDADSTLASYKNYLEMLFNHELTHIVHIDQHYRATTPLRMLFGKVVAPNGATPAWMREGMAVYEESILHPGFGRNNSPFTEMLMRSAIYENTFPRIDQIAGLSAHPPAGHGPYLYGGKFFQWLAEKYGEDRMYKYQKLYASSLWVFSLNNKARRVYEKSFYKLWDEFKADMTAKYMAQKDAIESQGVTSLMPVVSNDNSQRYYTTSPTGGYAYYEFGYDDGPRIVIVPAPGAEEQYIHRKLEGQMSFSKDGRYLAFASLASIEPKTSRSEVYYYDTKKKQLFRAYDTRYPNESNRLVDPDFSSADGGNRWLVSVKNTGTTDQLYIFDLFEKRGYLVTQEPKHTQFSQPRFSPDGQKIVVSRKDPETGFTDIVLYSKTGKRLWNVTNDAALDQHPIFSPNGHEIYFDSYRTGVSNIYKYSLKTKHLQRLSNVLTGVFQPMIHAQTGDVFVQKYESKRTSIQRFELHAVYRTSALDVPVTGQPVVQGRHYSIVLDQNNNAVLTAHPVPMAMQKNLGFNGQSSSHEHSVGAMQHSHSSPVPDFSKLTQFSMDPTQTEYLPVGSKQQNMNREDWPNVQVDDTNVKDRTEQEQTSTTYPSVYKNTLDQYPSRFETLEDHPEGAKPYHPFKHLLLPRYVMPSLIIYESDAILGLAVGKNDPLFRHSWSAFVNYRTDAGFVGGGGTYVYTRYKPTFYVGGLRYAVDWGDVSVTIRSVTTTQQFFEERNQGYAGMAFNIGRHQFNTSYFYEHRSAFTNLSVGLTNMKPYAGVRMTYSNSNYKYFADSISPENGYRIKVVGEWADSMLGSHDVNEQRVVRADVRYYFEMPWADHHVLAIRGAAGWAWGDQQQFGVFRLGGPFGEGPGVQLSSRLFPLRGLAGITYSGDQAVMFSAEYRLPIVTGINAGIGTWPIFIEKIQFNLFADGGDIRFRTANQDLFDRFLLSVGGEFSGHFVVGYGLPLQARLGYGIILTNRSRLGNLTDAVTRQSLRYGSAYFQLGTMF